MTLWFKHRTSVFYLCVAAGLLPGKVCAMRTVGYRKTYKKIPSVDGYRCFGGMYCLHIHCKWKVACPSEMLVTACKAYTVTIQKTIIWRIQFFRCILCDFAYLLALMFICNKEITTSYSNQITLQIPIHYFPLYFISSFAAVVAFMHQHSHSIPCVCRNYATLIFTSMRTSRLCTDRFQTKSEWCCHLLVRQWDL
jgi:hypothetical protein